MPLRDLYAALGLTTGATLEELKAAYRALTQKHHPDKEGGDIEAFQRIKKAYDILRSPERAAHYASSGKDSVIDEAGAALPTLATLLTQIVAQVDVVHVDIYEVLRENVLRIERQANTDIAGIESNISRFREAARRMGVTTGKTNLLAQVLEGQVAQHEKSLAAVRKQLHVAKLMLSMLDDCSYNFTEIVQPVRYTAASTGFAYATRTG